MISLDLSRVRSIVPQRRELEGEGNSSADLPDAALIVEQAAQSIQANTSGLPLAHRLEPG